MAKLADMIAHGKYLMEERSKLIPELAEECRGYSSALIREFVLSIRLALCEHDGWFIQAQAAREAGVHPGIICRMVRDEELRTNGRTGRECLLDPQSVLAYRDRRRKRKEERLSHR